MPAFAAEGGRILCVGCQAYTAGYFALLEAHGADVWSIDLMPEAEVWGHPQRHRTGDVCALEATFPGEFFTAIICNGVLGFGVNGREQQARALSAMTAALKPDGRLLLGWNTDRIADPVAADLTSTAFVPSPFAGQAARVTFAGLTHVYDSFTRLN